MKQGWALARQQVIFDKPWALAENNCYVTADGGWVDDYLIVRRSPFVLIVSEREGKVVLIEQYRPATDKSYISLPAGYLEDRETPTQAAERELQEETGYYAESFELLATLDPLPGFVSSPAHVIRCRITGQEGSRHDPDGEVSRVLLLSWDEILERIRRGAIDEMQAVAALLLAHKFVVR